jgi:hypothetical protein
MAAVMSRRNPAPGKVYAPFDQALWDEVLAFDMSVVNEVFADRNEQFGDQADVLEREAKRFLYLCAVEPSMELAPTKPIDEFWHQFILFTKEYQDFGHRFVGSFIEHEPIAGPRHAEIFEETQVLVREHFGESFEGVSLWKLPKPATSCRGMSKRDPRNEG